VREGKLRLAVEDNGVGMSPGRAVGLLEESPGGEGAGIGLRNVHERIRLNFGEAYGLRIESEREEGTVVTVWLPVLREEESDDAAEA
jgi:two-component system sensor histidine kinase YesM